MKCKITDEGAGMVSLRWPDGYVSYYRVAGYADDVRYVYDGSGRQVCERLLRTGNALRASSNTLAQVIRRELKRLQRTPEWEYILMGED